MTYCQHVAVMKNGKAEFIRYKKETIEKNKFSPEQQDSLRSQSASLVGALKRMPEFKNVPLENIVTYVCCLKYLEHQIIDDINNSRNQQNIWSNYNQISVQFKFGGGSNGGSPVPAIRPSIPSKL